MDLRALIEERNPWWREPHRRAARAFPARRELQPQVVRQVLRVEDRRATVVLGPRQVGKTTLLLQMADDLLDGGWPPANLTYFDFSDDRLTAEVSAREVMDTEPEGLDRNHPRAFLFDEVGRVPRWDRWLKQAVDARAGRFVVTDSAAALVRQKGRESGVGRWDERWLEGLTLRELSVLASPGEEAGEALRRRPELVDRYLALGGFPEFALAAQGGAALDEALVLRRLREGVVEKALLRDIAREVRDPRPVRALFVYLVQESGGIWNARKRASDLGKDERSLGHWLHLLEDTLLVVALPRYARHAAAGLRSRPRLYAADPGLVTAFSLLDRSEPEVRGRVLEAAVFRHLRELQREDPRSGLWYYRDRAGLEADFVLELPGSRSVIEVTGSARVKPEKAEAVRRVGERVGADRLVVVYGGTVAGEVGGVHVAPVGRFLLDPRKAAVP